MFDVKRTATFKAWFGTLEDSVKSDILTGIALLRDTGPNLGRPFVDKIRDGKAKNLKELRIQSGGRPYRIAFFFNKARMCVLLCGDVKDGAGSKDFYTRLIRVALKEIAEL